MTKGLIAPVFFVAAAVPYLLLSGQWRRWRQLEALHRAAAVSCHCGAVAHSLRHLATQTRDTPSATTPLMGNVHGFFYFYFINEHVLRFLGSAIRTTTTSMPLLWYWLAHLVWLFPWSLFLPAVLVVAWKTRRSG